MTIAHKHLVVRLLTCWPSDIAERVAAIYSPQVIAYTPPGGPDAVVLNQISLRRAKIVTAVRRFRELAEAAGATSLHLARRRLPGDYEEMIDHVEITVAEQPLPRLQTVGANEANFPFLYDLAWGPRAHFTVVRLHAAGPRGLEVPLRDGAGDELVRLAPLIRPLIEVHWTRMVAQLNGVAAAEEDLHRHLFGSERLRPPAPLRDGLAALQAERCFYCSKRLDSRSQADHSSPEYAALPSRPTRSSLGHHHSVRARRTVRSPRGAVARGWTAVPIGLNWPAPDAPGSESAGSACRIPLASSPPRGQAQPDG